MGQVKLIIPEGLREITLGQYQQFAKLSGDEEFMQHKMLEIFCGVELRQVLFLTLNQINECAALLSRAFEQKPNLIRTFRHKGVHYGFVPNLYDLTFGEYTDIEDNMNDWATMHKAMAVLFRPITNKVGELYAIEQYEGTINTSEIMKEMPLDVVFGAVNFMYRLGISLSRVTLRSIQKEMTEGDSQQVKGSSLNDGDGTHPIMPLLMVIQQNLMQFQNSITDSPIRTFNTR